MSTVDRLKDVLTKERMVRAAWPDALLRLVMTGSLLGVLLSFDAPTCGAQDVPPPPPPPAKTADTDAPPSLDDLLGLDEEETTEGGVSAEDVADRQSDDELQRRLDEEEIRNAFEEAVAKMSVAADQLDRHFDTGLGTQRVQEEVLAKLDQLIDEARQQQSSGGSSSSSSSSSSAAGQQQSPQGRKAESEGQPSPAQQGDSKDTKDRGPSDAPPGGPNSVFEEDRTEWGNLPERVREMLLQGRREKFSNLYEELTRDYYRRLAEEGS